MLDSTAAYGLTFHFLAGDTVIGAHLRDHGEFAKPELDLLLAYAGPSGTFLDIGANIGAIGLPFAAARRRWFVLAVEPQRPMSMVLGANAINNRLLNVEVFNAAAGAAAGLAQFPIAGLASRGNLGAIRFGMGAETEPVRVLTLDELAPDDTRLVKLDVEGFETEVLKGAPQLLAGRQAVWIAEATGGRPDLHAEVIRVFQDAGYHTYWFFSPFATPQAPKGAPARTGFGDTSIVALPPGVANLWALPPANPDQPMPSSLSGYAYLGRYGF